VSWEVYFEYRVISQPLLTFAAIITREHYSPTINNVVRVGWRSYEITLDREGVKPLDLFLYVQKLPIDLTQSD